MPIHALAALILLVIAQSLIQQPTPGDAGTSPITQAPKYPVAPYHLGGDVKPPILIYSAEPEFSEDARRAKKGGSVLVYLWVDAQGLPSHLRIVRGVGYGLDEKAVEAIRQYRFKPATLNGEPVTVDLNIEVNFQFKTR